MVKTREETALKSKLLSVRSNEKSPSSDVEPEEPNDEGIEYHYLREQNINVSY